MTGVLPGEGVLCGLHPAPPPAPTSAPDIEEPGVAWRETRVKGREPRRVEEKDIFGSVRPCKSRKVGMLGVGR